MTAAREAIDAGQAPRLLELLAGPCAPRRKMTTDDGRTIMREPYWRPELPGMTDAVWMTAGFGWDRPYSGPAVVLDRSGAWLSAAATVRVAHGQLTHTGPIDPPAAEPLPPGYYRLEAHPWQLDTLPSPLGKCPHPQVWVPEPTATLLRELAAAGLWGTGELEILDSYTATPDRPGNPAEVRLNAGRWATVVNELRTHAITTHGRDSEHYERVKVAYSQAVTLMQGSPESGHGRIWKASIHRPDWTHAIQAHSTATLWRGANACRQLAPDHPPIAMRNVDELVIPAEALPLVTDPARSIKGATALRIDQAGTQLGSYKIKAEPELNAGKRSRRG